MTPRVLVVLSLLRAIPMVLFLAHYRGAWRDPIARILRGLTAMNLLGALIVIARADLGRPHAPATVALYAGSLIYAVLSWYLYFVFLAYRRQGEGRP